jgi:hypothetical protein
MYSMIHTVKNMLQRLPVAYMIDLVGYNQVKCTSIYKVLPTIVGLARSPAGVGEWQAIGPAEGSTSH